MSRHYVAVTGGRDYDDAEWVDEIFRVLSLLYGASLRLIHGGAHGADSLAGDAAARYGVRVKVFPADWSQYGKSAGHRRNAEMAAFLQQMVADGHTAQCIAFDGGAGTSGMMAECERRQISVDSL
jgi:hypothetical protein